MFKRRKTLNVTLVIELKDRKLSVQAPEEICYSLFKKIMKNIDKRSKK